MPPCFLYGSGVHRDLHSFPTRRSSDLATRRYGSAWTRSRTRSCGGHTSGGANGWWPSPAARVSATRSEEHTSELQSRRDLVCRLLLEKKKYNRRTAPPHDDALLYHHPI